MDQTKWSTLNGCHLDEDDVVEAVRKVARDRPVSSSVTVGNRFTDNQYYGDVPAPPPRFHQQIYHFNSN